MFDWFYFLHDIVAVITTLGFGVCVFVFVRVCGFGVLCICFWVGFGLCFGFIGGFGLLVLGG